VAHLSCLIAPIWIHHWKKKLDRQVSFPHTVRMIFHCCDAGTADGLLMTPARSHPPLFRGTVTRLKKNCRSRRTRRRLGS
jgi:hypothetical protein